MDPFATLGVAANASDEEVATAYKALAKSFHPDQHPEASPAERAAWGAAMVNINKAWNAIKDPARQRPSKPRQPPTNATSPRPPRVGECDLCGSTPAQTFSFRHQQAYLISARLFSTELEMCRNCALAIGRSKQNRTLVWGWWGIIALVRNVAIAFMNARGLGRAGRLAVPRRAAGIVAPLDKPMSLGNPILWRSGFWVTTTVVVAITGFIAAGVLSWRPKDGLPSSAAAVIVPITASTTSTSSSTHTPVLMTTTLPATTTTLLTEGQQGLMTAQRLADAFADGDWSLARQINPTLAYTDAELARGYEPLDVSTLYLAGSSTNATGTDLWLTMVAHETVAGSPQTTLFCVHWKLIATNTIEQIGGKKVRTVRGFTEPTGLRAEGESACRWFDGTPTEVD